MCRSRMCRSRMWWWWWLAPTVGTFLFQLSRIRSVESFSAAAPSSHHVTIQVCQSKDCCQRWKMQTPLPFVLEDLVGTSRTMATGVAAATMTVVTIESTSCLSQCGKGPNVMVVDTSRRAVADNEDVVHRHQLYGVCDAVSAAAQLESLSIAVPSKLFAAVRVLEKAQTANLPQDKERFASSVIRALENDPDLRQSTANIRALVFRASLLMEQTGRSKEALTDAECAIDLLLRRASVETTTTDTTTTTTTGSSGSLLMAQAYRVLADVQELAENYPAAMEALQLMAVSQPAMRTKVVQELARMRQRAAAAAAAATV